MYRFLILLISISIIIVLLTSFFLYPGFVAKTLLAFGTGLLIFYLLYFIKVRKKEPYHIAKYMHALPFIVLGYVFLLASTVAVITNEQEIQSALEPIVKYLVYMRATM